MVVKFRKEEDAHKLLKRVKKMREEIEDVEDNLNIKIENNDIKIKSKFGSILRR